MIAAKDWPKWIQTRSRTLLILISLATANLTHASETLVILNWQDYFDPQLIKQFESTQQVQIRQVSFNSNEQRSERLLETEGRGYDLILVSGIDLKAYTKRGWLRRLSLKQLAHGDQIDRQWLERFPSANGYAVPYAWGALGVVYRKDLIAEPIISWQQLFQPNKQLSGHIGMLSTPRDLMGMALKALGNSANAENKHQLREARDLIKQQAQHVSTYNYLSTREDSEILRGNVRAAMISNGDALKLRRINSALEFVLPVEGGNLRIDYLAIPLHAKKPSLAIRFIDFITTAEHAAQQASYSFYAPIHRTARRLLPEQFLKDSKIFPQSVNLKNSEVYRHSSPMTMKYQNETLAQIHQ